MATDSRRGRMSDFYMKTRSGRLLEWKLRKENPAGDSFVLSAGYYEAYFSKAQKSELKILTERT